MEQIILIVHVLAALGIVGLILLQQGKGADMGASFGSGSSQTLFGANGGGNALTRATAILATIFFCTSLALAYNAKHKVITSGDIIEDIPTLEQSDGVVTPNDDGELPEMNSAPAGMDDMPAEMPADDMPAAATDGDMPR